MEVSPTLNQNASVLPTLGRRWSNGSSMVYLFLIIPHLLALVVLLGFAIRSGSRGQERGDSGDGWDDGPNGPPPPAPKPSGFGPPLPDAALPRRRVRVGGRLSELYPPRPRREIEPDRAPVRTPSRTNADEPTLSH